MSPLETATRPYIEAHQRARLQHGLARVLPHNRFYQQKFGDISTTLNTLTDLSHLPFTTKQELVADVVRSLGG